MAVTSNQQSTTQPVSRPASQPTRQTSNQPTSQPICRTKLREVLLFTDRSHCQSSQSELDTRAVVRVLKHFFDQQHVSAGVFYSLMAPPSKDDFERCSELRQWCLSHSGERPRRRSNGATTETSLALWLERAMVRRTRAFNNRPSCSMLTATETTHLNSILRTAQKQVATNASASSSGTTAAGLYKRHKARMELNPIPEGTEPAAPATSKRLRQKSHVSIQEVASKRIRTQPSVLTISFTEAVNTGGLNIQWRGAECHLPSSAP